MESVTRNVRDISPPDRLVLEHVIGRQLAENQQVIIQVCNLRLDHDGIQDAEKNGGGALPDWCNVYAGLSDNQISTIEEVILKRADLTRATE